MENNHNPMEDDGSLDFLKIPADETLTAPKQRSRS